MDSATEQLIWMHANDLRHTWQGRVLAAAEGTMMVVMSSVLAHTYDEAMAVLFRVVQPKCWDGLRERLRPPFLRKAGRVAKNGAIFSTVVRYDDDVGQDMILFKSLTHYERDLRKLADRLRLSDDERVEFFAVAKRWVVADFRLDPTMDPADPDAKRLTVH